MSDSDCLFCKILSGDIPADIVYESDAAIAFRDINPQAPTHVLVIPRKHIATINDLDESDNLFFYQQSLVDSLQRRLQEIRGR